MNSQIITIGDEILIGQVIDTNSAFIAQQLNLIGFKVEKILSVSDTKEAIVNALDESIKKVKLVILTGGLGPTSDDITKSVLAEYFNTQLVQNNEALERIKAILTSLSVTFNEKNINQADLPENCIPIPNNLGTASGMWFEKNGTICISMPGVPFEMKEMITNCIIPMLKKRFDPASVLHKTILTTGVGESAMAEKIKDWEDNLPGYIKLAYLPSPGLLRLRLSNYEKGDKESLIELNKQVDLLKKIIGNSIFGYDDDKLEEVVGFYLKKKMSTLSVAESCTGGMITHLITSVPGCSDYFKGSVVAYSNEIKTRFLNIPDLKIKEYGAVSENVVKEMANDIRKKFNTDYSIATSGIAGPTGGTADKPVGTVWIAISSKNVTIAKRFSLGDNRERNILKASITALNLLRLMIQD